MFTNLKDLGLRFRGIVRNEEHYLSSQNTLDYAMNDIK